MTDSIDNQITYLTKLEITGLWGKYDIVWDLNADVNVLAGGNGSGKSTILNSLYQTLSVKSNIYSESIDNIELFLNNGEWLCLKSFKLTAAEKELGKPKFEIKTNSPQLPSHELKKRINIDFISTFDTEAKPQELLQKAGRHVQTELDWELWLLQQEYTKYKVRIYKTNSEVNRATHIRFLAIIDELFLETHKRVNANKEELEFLLDNKEINTYQLSSGEKQLLIILLTVLIQDNKPSILFMDEPEISLHIEWQRKLIKYIRELNPNVQLIIATHSPDIIVHGWLDNVFNIQDLIVKDNTLL